MKGRGLLPFLLLVLPVVYGGAIPEPGKFEKAYNKMHSVIMFAVVKCDGGVGPYGHISIFVYPAEGDRKRGCKTSQPRFGCNWFEWEIESWLRP